MSKVYYKVCRDDIFCGIVVNTSSVHRYNDEICGSSIIKPKLGQLTLANRFRYRSTLFVPNAQNLSYDLLYKSPNYPILNITDDETCLSISPNTILIEDACSLAPLLEYFGCPKHLEFSDIIDIRNLFFSGHFAVANCELFGMKEEQHQPEKSIWYSENGEIITDTKKLRIKAARAKAEYFGLKSFSRVSEGVLPFEYWYILDMLGRNILLDVPAGKNFDTFKPYKSEGPIRKLGKF